MNAWEEWYQKKAREYSCNGSIVPIFIAKMYAWYGKKEGETCETCAFCNEELQARQLKTICKKYPEKGNGKWKKAFQACGLHLLSLAKFNEKAARNEREKQAIRY